jgi:hypothetical protein
MGSHAYDIEQLVLKVDARGTVEGIDFKPHNSSEHFRITDALDIKQILKDGHPQVYVSRGKHACYPVPGTVTRYLGVVSDVCEHPVKQDLTAIVLDEAVINVRYIGKGFPGIKKRLVPNPSVPRIRLNEVRLHNALPLFR